MRALQRKAAEPVHIFDDCWFFYTLILQIAIIMAIALMQSGSLRAPVFAVVQFHPAGASAEFPGAAYRSRDKYLPHSSSSCVRMGFA